MDAKKASFWGGRFVMQVIAAFSEEISKDQLQSAVKELIWHVRKPSVRNQLRSIQDRRNGYYGFIKGKEFQVWQYPVSYALYPGYVNLNHVLISGEIDQMSGNVRLHLKASLNPIGKSILTLAGFLLLLLACVIILSTGLEDKIQLIAPLLVVLVPTTLIYLVMRYEMKAEMDYYISLLNKKIERMP